MRKEKFSLSLFRETYVVRPSDCCKERSHSRVALVAVARVGLGSDQNGALEGTMRHERRDDAHAIDPSRTSKRQVEHTTVVAQLQTILQHACRLRGNKVA